MGMSILITIISLASSMCMLFAHPLVAAIVICTNLSIVVSTWLKPWRYNDTDNVILGILNLYTNLSGYSKFKKIQNQKYKELCQYHDDLGIPHYPFSKFNILDYEAMDMVLDVAKIQIRKRKFTGELE